MAEMYEFILGTELGREPTNLEACTHLAGRLINTKKQQLVHFRFVHYIEDYHYKVNKIILSSLHAR